VKVVNPGGQSSAAFNFTVTVPARKDMKVIASGRERTASFEVECSDGRFAFNLAQQCSVTDGGWPAVEHGHQPVTVRHV
jgi:hypothetical protein